MASKKYENSGLIQLLTDVGFTPEEIKDYLELSETSPNDEEQIRMVRRHRRKLLDDIHEKQKLLDKLDFIIWEKKHKV
ncbi:MAG: MerR family DNA-binding protein [Ruminococcus flavefaciens]|nr:MerR family DNA-binding protein [Ruminococcus flavefaciens]MCM1060968.1 MerR family DNA-binding protein [Eubacterium sp.]